MIELNIFTDINNTLLDIFIKLFYIVSASKLNSIKNVLKLNYTY